LKRVAFTIPNFDGLDEKAFISAGIWHVARAETIPPLRF